MLSQYGKIAGFLGSRCGALRIKLAKRRKKTCGAAVGDRGGAAWRSEPPDQFKVDEAGGQALREGIGRIGEVFDQHIGDGIGAVDEVKDFEGSPNVLKVPEW